MSVNAAFAVGRAMFGSFFLYNGINHFRNRKMLAQYAGSKSVPASEAAVLASEAALIFGGASILSGWHPKWGAAAIAGFLGTVSPTIHNFWAIEDPGQQQADQINFMKNMALLGGALAIAGVEEPWPLSIELPKHKAGPVDRVIQFTKKFAA